MKKHIKTFTKGKLTELMGPAETQYAPPGTTACNNTMTAGDDTAVTEVVELGQNAGNFIFDWETFSQQDRITLSYEGAMLFDSTCTGNNGSEPITYSGASSQVTVQVFPNCAGGSGTAWNFTVNCPN